MSKRKIWDIQSNGTLLPSLSGAAVTFIEKDCRPFWGSYAMEWSREIPSCSKNDMVESDATTLGSSARSLVPSLPFALRISEMKEGPGTGSIWSSEALSRTIRESVRFLRESECEKQQEANDRKRQKRVEENQERQRRSDEGISREDQTAIDLLVAEKDRLQQLYDTQTDIRARKTTRGKITRCSNDIRKLLAQYKPPEPLGEPLAVLADGEVPTDLLRARKIKIRPTKEERKVLESWFGTARFVYNACVSHSRTLEVPYEGKVKSMREYRDHTRAEAFLGDNPWLNEVSSVIKDDAVSDFVKALKSNHAKRKKDPSFRFQIGFRSRKKLTQQTVYVNARDWTQKKGYFAFLRKIKASEKLPEKLHSRLSISRTNTGYYYFSIVRPPERKPDFIEEPKTSIVALDPGVRTFQTCYDSSGLVTEWGQSAMNQMFRALLAADRLRSKVDSAKEFYSASSCIVPSRSERRWFKLKHMKLRAALRKMLWRLKNKVSHMHKSLCSFLVNNYDVILLPEFQAKKVSAKATRKIGARSVRAMLTWRHYDFRQRLVAKAKATPGCTLVVCDEAFTSKTCGSCGVLNQSLGRSKNFNCQSCGLQADRDVNAARNILLRFTERVNVRPNGPNRPNTNTNTTQRASTDGESQRESAAHRGQVTEESIDSLGSCTIHNCHRMIEALTLL